MNTGSFPWKSFFRKPLVWKVGLILAGTATLSLIAWSQLPETIDLGSVAINQPVRAELAWAHRGSHPIITSDAVTSCPCTTVTSVPDRIEPGTTASAFARFIPDKPGPFHISIAIHGKGWFQKKRFALSGVVETPRPGWQTADTLEAGLFISPAELRLQMESPTRPYLLDLRAPERFSASHIPGSVALPLSALAMTVGDPSRAVVVIDGGEHGRSTLETISQMRRNGWDQLHLLDGGLPAWHAAGGPLVGLAPVATSLRSISPSGWLASGDPRWAVIDLTGRGKSTVASWLKVDDVLSLDPKDSRLGQKLEKYAGPSRRLVIITQSGENPHILQQKIPDGLSGRILILEGGLDGFANYLKNNGTGRTHQTVSLSSNQSRSPSGVRSRTSGCSSCP